MSCCGQDTAVSQYLHSEEEGSGGNDDTSDNIPSDVVVLVVVVPASFQTCPVSSPCFNNCNIAMKNLIVNSYM